MKAAIVPSPNSTWQIKETNTPEPGENQVLIKIHASGMCYTDVHQARGECPVIFHARSATNRLVKSLR